VEIKDLEENAKVERACTPDEEVDMEEQAWISDVRTNQGCNKKYYRAIELYWHMKTVMGHALVT